MENPSVKQKTLNRSFQKMIAVGISMLVCAAFLSVIVWAALDQNVVITDSVRISTDGQALCNIKAWKTHGPDNTAFAGNGTDISGTVFNASADIATEANTSNLIGRLDASPTENTAAFNIPDRLRSDFSYIGAQYDIYKIFIENTSTNTPVRYNIQGITSSALTELSSQLRGYYGDSIVSEGNEWILGNDVGDETYIQAGLSATIFVVIALNNAETASGLAARDFVIHINVYAAHNYTPPLSDVFEFEITTDDGTFTIPTSGNLNGSFNKTYTWNVYIDNELATSENGISAQPVTGTQSSEHIGVTLTNLSNGTHKISLQRVNDEYAWLGAFGFFMYMYAGDSNTPSNKDKLTKVITPFTADMTRSAAQISDPTGAQPSHEYYFMFYECTNLTMGPKFNLPQDIVTAGEHFSSNMFSQCYGENFNMNRIFNIPQNIETTGNYFLASMFANCSGTNFTMNDVFNIPQGITTVNGAFLDAMFHSCGGTNFTMNEVFNIPQGITTTSSYFLNNMFYNCWGANFTMNEVFNIPQGIIVTGQSFLNNMFNSCRGANFTMNEAFNIPQGITMIGTDFLSYMFANCSGPRFAMNGMFNIPQGITAVDRNFLYYMFYNAGNANFQINNIFKFPVHESGQVNKNGVFGNVLYFHTSCAVQNRTAISIINNNSIPSSRRYTFNSRFSDYTSLPTNWKG